MYGDGVLLTDSTATDEDQVMRDFPSVVIVYGQDDTATTLTHNLLVGPDCARLAPDTMMKILGLA